MKLSLLFFSLVFLLIPPDKLIYNYLICGPEWTTKQITEEKSNNTMYSKTILSMWLDLVCWFNFWKTNNVNPLNFPFLQAL